VPESPKSIFRSFASQQATGRWCFTYYELEHPENCRASDLFAAPVGEIGVLVRRDGTVTNQWADGTSGVPAHLRDDADFEDVLYKLGHGGNAAQNDNDEETCVWRNVKYDVKTGRFLDWGAKTAMDMLDEV